MSSGGGGSAGGSGSSSTAAYAAPPPWWPPAGAASGQSATRQNTSWPASLTAAAHDGNAQAVAAYLQVSAADAVDAHGDTALIIAACRGYANVARAVLAAGASADKANTHGTTPLIMAAGRGHVDIVVALLDAKAKLDEEDESGDSALRRAAKGGHEQVLQLLASAGAALDTQYSGFRTTALHEAAFHGKPGAVRVLAAAGATVDRRDWQGRTPLFLATMHGNNEVASALLAAGANVNLSDTYVDTPLMQAALRGDTTMVRMLVDAGASVHDVDVTGCPTVAMAAVSGSAGATLILLNAGAQPTMAVANWRATQGAALQTTHTSYAECFQVGSPELRDRLLAVGFYPDNLPSLCTWRDVENINIHDILPQAHGRAAQPGTAALEASPSGPAAARTAAVDHSQAPVSPEPMNRRELLLTCPAVMHTLLDLLDRRSIGALRICSKALHQSITQGLPTCGLRIHILDVPALLESGVLQRLKRIESLWLNASGSAQGLLLPAAAPTDPPPLAAQVEEEADGRLAGLFQACAAAGHALRELHAFGVAQLQLPAPVLWQHCGTALRRLALRGLSPTWLPQLSQLAALTGLQELELHMPIMNPLPRNQHDFDSPTPLFSWLSDLKSLTLLDVDGLPVSASLLVALGQLPHLKELALRQLARPWPLVASRWREQAQDIHDDVVRSGGAPRFPQLRALTLHNPNFPFFHAPDLLRLLLEATSALTSLTVRQAKERLQPGVAAGLAHAPSLLQLHIYDANHKRDDFGDPLLTDVVLSSWAARFTRLQSLRLSCWENADVTDAGIKQLVLNLPQLRQLHLEGLLRITPAAVSAVFQNATSLQRLQLDACPGVTPPGLQQQQVQRPTRLAGPAAVAAPPPLQPDEAAAAAAQKASAWLTDCIGTAAGDTVVVVRPWSRGRWY